MYIYVRIYYRSFLCKRALYLVALFLKDYDKSGSWMRSTPSSSRWSVWRVIQFVGEFVEMSLSMKPNPKSPPSSWYLPPHAPATLGLTSSTNRSRHAHIHEPLLLYPQRFVKSLERVEGDMVCEWVVSHVNQSCHMRLWRHVYMTRAVRGGF